MSSICVCEVPGHRVCDFCQSVSVSFPLGEPRLTGVGESPSQGSAREIINEFPFAETTNCEELLGGRENPIVLDPVFKTPPGDIIDLTGDVPGAPKKRSRKAGFRVDLKEQRLVLGISRVYKYYYYGHPIRKSVADNLMGVDLPEMPGEFVYQLDDSVGE